MIAVEWVDERMNRNSDGSVSVRTGVLLQLLPEKDDYGHIKGCAAIITRRLPHDSFVDGHKRPVGDFPNIIKVVDITKLIVKGVHIPFEPHGAEK